jgi:toxin ParE1/3/4
MVLWTESALAQLQAIHDYLAQSSPEYALRIVDRLTARSIQIATFPFSGRMVPEYELNQVRELGAEDDPQRLCGDTLPR